MAICFLGIGSNLGNRKRNINRAISKISEFPNTKLLDKANIYETLPVSPIKQSKYLNTAVKIKTKLSPDELFSILKETEKILGRKKRERWAPRIIDIDILFYDDININTDILVIPHPLLHKRIFVLKPLNDIASEFKHPLLGKTISKLLDELL